MTQPTDASGTASASHKWSLMDVPEAGGRGGEEEGSQLRHMVT